MPARSDAHLSRPRLVQASLFAGTDDPVLVALRDADLAALSPEQRRCSRAAGSARTERRVSITLPGRADTSRHCSPPARQRTRPRAPPAR
ncbi:MAG: hypothetical protein U0736_01130 [Gemmataceae bacterium]